MNGPRGLELVRRAFRDNALAELPLQAVVPTCLDAPKPYLAGTGEEALGVGRVAILMVAGGLSTRMGGDGLRGELAIGPVTSRSIFQLHAETIAALRRRYRSAIPLLVMTSNQVHHATVACFQRHNLFGLSDENVKFFQQPSLPVVNQAGQPIPLADGGWMTAPAGHGGMLTGMKRAGLIEWLTDKGVELLFYFQFPNVLERICDPLLLGTHICGGYEATCKGFAARNAEEKVGRIVALDHSSSGSIRIIEYHGIEQRGRPAWLIAMPANSGTHVWSLEFLKRCARENICLPYYIVQHRLPHDGRLMWKTEQMVFDLLPYAQSSGYYQVERDKEYAAVKNRTGSDTLIASREKLSRVYRNWLDSAGAIGDPRDAVAEISPLFALDEAELKQKIPPGLIYRNGAVFDERTYGG